MSIEVQMLGNAKMTYRKPEEVDSPRAMWRLVEVIIDKGEGKPAYALGTWAGERRVGMRWNGTDDNPIGNPQSRGLPTYIMLDEDLHSAVLAIAPEEKKHLIKAFLGLP